MAHADATPPILCRVPDHSPARFLVRWGPPIALHPGRRPYAVPPQFTRPSGGSVCGGTAAHQKVRGGYLTPRFGTLCIPLWACHALRAAHGPAAGPRSPVLIYFFHACRRGFALRVLPRTASLIFSLFGWGMRGACAPRHFSRPGAFWVCAAGRPSAECFRGRTPGPPVARCCALHGLKSPGTPHRAPTKNSLPPQPPLY